MKKLFVFILLFVFFSCEKDEPTTLSAKYSKEEIFNAVLGTWKFNRLAYDPEFKKIKQVEAKDCSEYDRTIFYPNGKMTRTFMEGCTNLTPNRIGDFYIRIGGYYENDTDGTYVVTENSGVFLAPGATHSGTLTLHSFTDSTLVFSEVTYELKNGDKEYNLYSELKRVR